MNYTNTWGTEVIDIALTYANHEWYAAENNVKHGLDLYNNMVDTPDVTWTGKELHCGWWKVNELNKGIPYSWGGASTIEEFDRGLLNGKYAGNVPEDKSRHGSYDCVVIDCSGLLSVCWKLPNRVTTRDIPNIANRIETPEDIRKGDILAKLGNHVMLFVGFSRDEKDTAIIIDSTRSTGKVSLREVNMKVLFHNGYGMYRKLDFI